MAARKKATKAKTPKEQFLVLSSSCGDVSQLEPWGDVSFPSLAAAQKEINTTYADEEAEYIPSSIFVVKVVAKGGAKGFSWE